MTMTTFSFYNGQQLIGRSRLPFGDPPMGVAYGPFEPTDAYQHIQYLFTWRQSTQEAATLEGQRCRQAIEAQTHALQLRVIADDGKELHPVGGIAIEDVTEEVNGEEGWIEIALLGLDSMVYEHYFPGRYAAYVAVMKQNV
jgi:hypothetical protein